MKSEVLLAYVERLEKDADRHKGMPRDGSPNAVISNAKKDGYCDAMRFIAGELRALIGIVG